MPSKEKFYITTTLPYVNSDPHLGFALEMVQADVIARYHGEVLGQDVFFNTGTDEHGQKVFTKAQASGKDLQAYVDEYAEKFKQLMPELGISSAIHFIRTTDAHHIKAAQEFWKLCDAKGDIYKKIYQVKYCVGCELEKTESDLDENGHCLIHPNLEIELIDEENYFFKFSKYQQPLLDYYSAHPDFVVPGFRFNEIKQFVKSGLQDFSISRLKSKMSWGVPVPGDEAHVMYVWFDALINYVSTLGWPETTPSATHPPLLVKEGMGPAPRSLQPSPPLQGGVPVAGGGGGFTEYWGTLDHPNAIQIAGKDNLRQQSAMWQAMLMSAGLPNSKQIIIHGFINSGGQKMSKSLGNVADPYQIVEDLKSKGLNQEQAIDALRYYLIREISTFEDGDYTWEKLVESYNAGLANGIGNLTSRILKMAVNAAIKPIVAMSANQYVLDNYNVFLRKYELQKVADEIWKQVALLDRHIQKNEPFKKIKTNPEEATEDILYLLDNLKFIAAMLQPFLPETSKKILAALQDPKLETIPRLFPRIEQP